MRARRLGVARDELSHRIGDGVARVALPGRCFGWRRFIYATQTLIYHELAILGTALVVLTLTWGAPNQFGAWTFAILWLARLSAKLNVYLGVPNLTEEFLPRHLEYLKTYFRNRPMNLLFPISVTLSTLLTILCVGHAIAPKATSFEATGWTLLSSLMSVSSAVRALVPGAASARRRALDLEVGRAPSKCSEPGEPR